MFFKATGDFAHGSCDTYVICGVSTLTPARVRVCLVGPHKAGWKRGGGRKNGRGCWLKKTLGSQKQPTPTHAYYQPTNRPPASSALLGGPPEFINRKTHVSPAHLTTTADCAGAGLSGAHAGGTQRRPSALGGLGRTAGAHEGWPVSFGRW